MQLLQLNEEVWLNVEQIVKISRVVKTTFNDKKQVSLAVAYHPSTRDYNREEGPQVSFIHVEAGTPYYENVESFIARFSYNSQRNSKTEAI